MKKEECKISLKEHHDSFVKNPIVFTSVNKTVIIFSTFLLLIVISFTVAFTFLSLLKLRQEVEELKLSLKNLQEITTNYSKPTSTDILTDDDPLDADYHIYDEPEIYDDTVYADDDYNYYDEAEIYDDNISTVKKFTKDAKQATAPPRTKRNVKYVPNSSESNELNQRNLTGKDNKSSIYTYPQLGAKGEIDQITSKPRRSKKGHSKSVAFKSGDSYNPQTFQENPDVDFWVVGEDQQGIIRTRHRPRRLELEERHVRTGRMRPLPSAHFNGDTSRYVLGQHDNFNGNGHLRHPQRTFVDWTESSWVRALGMDRHFSLTDGFLTIKESGLYFIYAQIYYYDVHDINGFRVYKNETETLLQCTTMTHSDESLMKGNTCFTAGAEYLNEYDRISLADLSESRYSLFEPGKSFFGLIKLGDVKIK